MSHSGDCVLYALAGTPVGADIESPSARHSRFDLASYLHPDERDAVAALPAGRRPAALLNCWVRKEAYLKGTGAGIAAGVGSVHVGLGPAFPDDRPSATPEGWTLLDVAAPRGHVAAVALASGDGGPMPAMEPLRPRLLDLGAQLPGRA
jgi:4'-phosphopantetheinyl transferase